MSPESGEGAGGNSSDGGGAAGLSPPSMLQDGGVGGGVRINTGTSSTPAGTGGGGVDLNLPISDNNVSTTNDGLVDTEWDMPCETDDINVSVCMHAFIHVCLYAHNNNRVMYLFIFKSCLNFPLFLFVY